MSFLGNLFGSAAAEPIKAIAKGLDAIFTSDEERLSKKIILERVKNLPLSQQVEINKIEAAHPSLFVAGWRPFIGWVCGICLIFYFIPQFIIADYLWIKICLAKQVLVPYPLSVWEIIGLLGSMLGVHITRGIEKIKGVARN